MLKESLSFSHSHSSRGLVSDSLKTSNLRIDGRRLDSSRPHVLSLRRHEGVSSAELWIGRTRALAEVSGELVQPYIDRPAEGFLQFSVEFSPMGSESFDPGRPSMEAIEVTRILERTVIDSQALDTEALCVINAERVWSIKVNVTILDDDGNLIDASVLAAMSALQHFRRPEVSIIQKEATENAIPVSLVVVHHSDEKPTTPLPLHHVPIVVTFGLMENEDEISAILDPSEREEAVMSGRISFSINAHKELCSIHKIGGCPLSPQRLVKLGERASLRGAEVHSWMTSELLNADNKAQAERRTRLRGKEFKGQITVRGEAMAESAEATKIDHLGYNQLNVSIAIKDEEKEQITTDKNEEKTKKKGTKKRRVGDVSGVMDSDEEEEQTNILSSDFTSS